jgi:hypothetical protein
MAPKAKTTKTAEVKPATVTRPEELAKELGISGKQIRAWLRKTFEHEKRTSWLLNQKQAEAVREHFSKSEEDGEE